MEQHNHAILRMHCPDQSGIITVITGFINENGGNILYLDQYVDRDNGVFYMRVEWDLSKFVIPKEKISDYFGTLYGKRYNMTFRISFTEHVQRMAIFVSKMSHCIYDLLARYTAGEWDVEIPLIISNHPDLKIIGEQFNIPFEVIPVNKDNKAEQEAKEFELLDRYNIDFIVLARYTAGEWDVEIPLIISNHPDLKIIGEQFNIPFEVIPINKDNKAEQEAKEFELLDRYNIDFIVLARYMQVLSTDFIERYPNRIINIHHSFLPAFVGAKPYHQAYERGVKLIGATSHYVTAELDAGPIIEQDIARVSHKDTIADLTHKGRDLEKIVLSRAVEKHIQRKILTFENKTIVFN